MEKSTCQLHLFGYGNPCVVSAKSMERNAQFSCDIALLNYPVCAERDLQSGLKSIDYVAELKPPPGGEKKKKIIKTEPEKEKTSTQAAKVESKPPEMEII